MISSTLMFIVSMGCICYLMYHSLSFEYKVMFWAYLRTVKLFMIEKSLVVNKVLRFLGF